MCDRHVTLHTYSSKLGDRGLGKGDRGKGKRERGKGKGEKGKGIGGRGKGIRVVRQIIVN
ncbi:hypothetical protein BLD44_016910 [Mastigocladus laminosus UU774]|nr:hypothetical protein BLD44_016910 [Mastigocladus laminosus UU774]